MSPERMDQIYGRLSTCESMRGKPLPQASIAPIMRLVSVFENIDVVIGNPERTTREIREMQKNLREDAFIFWDEYGREFPFSNESWAMKYNRTFVVARLSTHKRRITIYVRF